MRHWLAARLTPFVAYTNPQMGFIIAPRQCREVDDFDIQAGFFHLTSHIVGRLLLLLTAPQAGAYLFGDMLQSFLYSFWSDRDVFALLRQLSHSPVDDIIQAKLMAPQMPSCSAAHQKAPNRLRYDVA